MQLTTITQIHNSSFSFLRYIFAYFVAFDTSNNSMLSLWLQTRYKKNIMVSLLTSYLTFNIGNLFHNILKCFSLLHKYYIFTVVVQTSLIEIPKTIKRATTGKWGNFRNKNPVWQLRQLQLIMIDSPVEVFCSAACFVLMTSSFRVI